MESTEYRGRVLKMKKYEPLAQRAQYGYKLNYTPRIPNNESFLLNQTLPLINPPHIPTLFIGEVDTSKSIYRPVATANVLPAPVKQSFDKALLSAPVPQFINMAAQFARQDGDMWYNASTGTWYERKSNKEVHYTGTASSLLLQGV